MNTYFKPHIFNRVGFDLSTYYTKTVLTGSPVYKIYGIAPRPVISGLFIRYREGSCIKKCFHTVNLTVTEYVAKRHYTVTIFSSTLPFDWANTMSKGSCIVEMNNQEECLDCELEVIVKEQFSFLKSTQNHLTVPAG